MGQQRKGVGKGGAETCGRLAYLPIGDALGRYGLGHRLVPAAVLPELVALANVPSAAGGVPHHHVGHTHHLVHATLGDDAKLDAAVLAELVLQEIRRRWPMYDHSRRRADGNAFDVRGLLPPALCDRPDAPWVFDFVRRLCVALDLEPATSLAELLLLAHVPRRRSVRCKAKPQHVVGVVVLLVCGSPVQRAAGACVLAKLVLVDLHLVDLGRAAREQNTKKRG